MCINNLAPSTNPLRPVKMDNACPSRITAAAGTSISRDLNFYSLNVNKKFGFYGLLTFVINVMWLDQAYAHCPIFPTAGLEPGPCFSSSVVGVSLKIN